MHPFIYLSKYICKHTCIVCWPLLVSWQRAVYFSNIDLPPIMSIVAMLCWGKIQIPLFHKLFDGCMSATSHGCINMVVYQHGCVSTSIGYASTSHGCISATSWWLGCHKGVLWVCTQVAHSNIAGSSTIDGFRGFLGISGDFIASYVRLSLKVTIFL